MSWGNKLLVAFLAFAGLIATLVYKSMHTRYELVSKEYYKDELRYQDKIDGKQNAAAISKVTFTQDKEAVTIQLPQELQQQAITGDVWFYCKTDAGKDYKTTFTGNSFQVMKHQLPAVQYQVKITWQAAGKQYYTEQDITLQ